MNHIMISYFLYEGLLIIPKSFLALDVVKIHVSLDICAFAISYFKKHLKKLVRKQYILES